MTRFLGRSAYVEAVIDCTNEEVSLRRGEADIDCTKEEIPVPYNEAHFDCAQEKVFMMKL